MTTPETNAVAEYEQKQQQDKELNFRKLEQSFQQKLEQERQARLDAERKAEEALKLIQSKQQHDDDDDTDDPYVDHKRLNKKLSNFEKTMEQKIEQKAETIARSMVEQQKNVDWVKRNPDYMKVIEDHAAKIYHLNPELAEAILQMPDTFERQRLVYNNIKALGLDKPAVHQPSIQEKIDANRRSPYYQPSGIGTAPYNANQGDFSQQGQEQAFKKMRELQNKMMGKR